MSGKLIYENTTPKTQSADAVKRLLTWRGRAVDPMPSTLEFINECEWSRLVLFLSNKKDPYYVVTPTKCSCPAATYPPGQPCKHQRRFYPQEQAATVATADSGSIRPTGKWPGGYGGPADERSGAPSQNQSQGRAQGRA